MTNSGDAITDVASLFDDVGGDPLAGSGFEDELPEQGYGDELPLGVLGNTRTE